MLPPLWKEVQCTLIMSPSHLIPGYLPNTREACTQRLIHSADSRLVHNGPKPETTEMSNRRMRTIMVYSCNEILLSNEKTQQNRIIIWMDIKIKTP